MTFHLIAPIRPKLARWILLAGAASALAAAPATTAPATRPSTDDAGRAQAAADTQTPTTQPSADSAGNRTPDQILSDMLQHQPPEATAGQPLTNPDTAPTTDSSSGAGSVKPGAAVSLRREGSFVVDRVGRLVHNADGTQAQFTFDSDGAAMKDPPLIILPNLKLMAMEDADKSSDRDLHFRVTGTITEYRGRNYVLLEKVVVVPDATRQFDGR